MEAGLKAVSASGMTGVSFAITHIHYEGETAVGTQEKWDALFARGEE